MQLHSKPEGRYTWGISDQKKKKGKNHPNSKAKDFDLRCFPP